jgi:cell division protein FtsA
MIPTCALIHIGSSKTTAIIAEVVGEPPRHPGIKVLGVSAHDRLRRRLPISRKLTRRSRRPYDAERMSGARVDHLYTGIAGEHMEAMISKGIVVVSGEEISRSDIDRVNAVARTRDIPQDRELLHAIPQEYTVDRQEGIREPVGMIGTRLETEMYLVTIASALPNLRRAVERATTRQELVLEPLASAACRADRRRKRTWRRVDRDGAGSTDVAVFHEGKISIWRRSPTVKQRHERLSCGLGLTQADAERVK